MKAPTIYTLAELVQYANTKENTVHIKTSAREGKFVCARPEGFYSIKHRIKCAWMALTGKADLVTWPDGQ